MKNIDINSKIKLVRCIPCGKKEVEISSIENAFSPEGKPFLLFKFFCLTCKLNGSIVISAEKSFE